MPEYNFNRYARVINFISKFLTRDTDTEEMYKYLSSLGKKSMK